MGCFGGKSQGGQPGKCKHHRKSGKPRKQGVGSGR